MYKSIRLKILGISIILFVIYRTLFITRISYKINEYIADNVIYLVILIFLLDIVVIIKLLIPNTRSYPFFFKVLNLIYYEPLKTVGDWALKYSVINNIVKLYGDILNISIKNKSMLYVFIFVWILYPKLFISIALFLDVFLLKKIYLFYKSLWLLFIYLITQAFLYLVHTYMNLLKVELEEVHLIVKVNKTLLFEMQSKYPMPKKVFDSFIMDWKYYSDTLDIINIINIVKTSVSYRICLILIIFITCISWGNYIYITLSAKWLFMLQENILFINLKTWLYHVLIGI